MLLIKTKLAPSSIAGIGLFANEPIAKGTVVWKFEPKLDLLLTKKEADSLTASAREQFYNYAYLDKKYNKYMLCGDDGRFFNHSLNPNCDERRADMTTALRDIAVGEELTVNYGDFYGDIHNHTEIEK